MSSEPKLPSEIEFASFLAYNPKPQAFPSKISAWSRTVCNAVKKDTAAWAKRQNLGVRLRCEVGERIREKFLPSNATLVPVPGHAPMKDPNSHWSCRELCRVFVASGLGSRWIPLVQRAYAVQKSAWATKEERAKLTPAMHYASMDAVHDFTAGSIITVVDDVVTSGGTLLATVARLQAVFPGASIRGFALIRAMSSEAIERVKEPCEGVIRLVPWGARRDP